MTGFESKRKMAADKQHWNEDEWRRNNWRCSHGWLRGEQCESCNAAQEPDWKEQYEYQKRRAEMWIAKYEKDIGPLEKAQPAQESYDQTALELCNVCGWKTLIPDDCCLNCERAQPAQEPVAFDAFLESEDFYELMQAYRHFPIDALVKFEAVKDALRTAHNIKERNFCPRCGKRTNDIHTCTPPQ